MKIVSTFATAALIAAALPAASRADDRDHARVAPVQAPFPAPYDPRRDVRDGPYRDGSYDRDVRRDGRALWRVNELREVRQAIRNLELERERFYASGWHRPREVRRFERWYAYRRAELERRREALQAYAWR